MLFFPQKEETGRGGRSQSCAEQDSLRPSCVPLLFRQGVTWTDWKIRPTAWSHCGQYPQPFQRVRQALPQRAKVWPWVAWQRREALRHIAERVVI
jgi:hypothetical protein